MRKKIRIGDLVVINTPYNGHTGLAAHVARFERGPDGEREVVVDMEEGRRVGLGPYWGGAFHKYLRRAGEVTFGPAKPVSREEMALAGRIAAAAR